MDNISGVERTKYNPVRREEMLYAWCVLGPLSLALGLLFLKKLKDATWRFP